MNDKSPSPAAEAARIKKNAERSAERERVKVVRKRARLRRGAAITSHVSQGTAAALAKLAHPDMEDRHG